MRATLFHNPRAGQGEERPDRLISLIEAQGYSVEAVSTKTDACKRALEDPGDLAVAAGGDGTVGKIALRLRQRDVPLLIVPCGTANNIARSLGLCADPELLISGLREASRSFLDAGSIAGPCGESLFIESAGAGLLTKGMRAAEEVKEPDAALEILRSLAESMAPVEAAMRFDGHELEGRFLLIEIMNFGLVGPNLNLAPSASPLDGRLDLVLVREERRRELLRFLDDTMAGRAPAHGFPAYSVEEVWLRASARCLHIDDEPYPEGRTEDVSVSGGGRSELRLQVLPQTIPLLIPPLAVPAQGMSTAGG